MPSCHKHILAMYVMTGWPVCVPIGTASWSCTTVAATPTAGAIGAALAVAVAAADRGRASKPWFSFCRMFGAVCPRGWSGTRCRPAIAGSWSASWRPGRSRTPTSSSKATKRHLTSIFYSLSHLSLSLALVSHVCSATHCWAPISGPPETNRDAERQSGGKLKFEYHSFYFSSSMSSARERA